MPAWVVAGFNEYAKRLPHACRLRLVEIAPAKRGRHPDVERMRREEGDRLLTAVPRAARVIALEVDGTSWRTEQLADRLRDWLQDGRDLALMVGGPDGLSAACRERAELCWSLSPLTLPHPLVRVLLAEQLYRAWSLVRGHPYHRGEAQ